MCGNIQKNRFKIIFLVRPMKNIQLAPGLGDIRMVIMNSGSFYNYVPIQHCKICSALNTVDCSWKSLTQSTEHVFVSFDFKEMSQGKCSER